ILGLQSNEITIHHHDENEKYHGCLKLVEADKPKQFKIYKQVGQYFDINGVITRLDEIKNNQGPLRKTVQLQYTINLEFEFASVQENA
ncbi:27197_t:CDS:2, partial [Dentiscutata erythropus]